MPGIPDVSDRLEETSGIEYPSCNAGWTGADR